MTLHYSVYMRTSVEKVFIGWRRTGGDS